MSETVAPAGPQGSVEQRSDSRQTSQTAADYISAQLQLEAEAREALPYQFNTCTKPLGPLRQSVFACLTCTPPPPPPPAPLHPSSSSSSFTPAGVCYSCSIACHGQHALVELFAKRDFECDCGTSRFRNGAPCTLRQGVRSGEETARAGNVYNQNYQGRFCGCGEEYDPAVEKGTMFQCLGLGKGPEEDGGCGEDWWHPECLMGLPRVVKKEEGMGSGVLATVRDEEGSDHEDEPPLPEGFPAEDDFEHLICYKCADAFPWIKQYAGTPGFLPAVPAEGQPQADGHSHDAQPDTDREDAHSLSLSSGSKRRAEDDIADEAQDPKKVKTDREGVPKTAHPNASSAAIDTPVAETLTSSPHQPNDSTAPRHTTLPPASTGRVTLFLKSDFRDHLCRCPTCFPLLAQHPPLLEEEETYEPPLSETASNPASLANQSIHSASLLERGEAALSSMDRVKAIEGVMAYNHVKEKVKDFLRPFAQEGRVVSAEEIRGYFARLRGDEEVARTSGGGEGEEGVVGDGRREQGGY